MVFVRLEVAEPGVFAALLEICEPCAEGIEGKDYQDPRKVDARQAESPAGRRVEGVLAQVRGLEHPLDAAESDKADDHGEEMDERQVKHKVKQRHAPINECGAQPARCSVVECAQQQHRWTQCHQQKEQGWRVFCGVQEREKREER